jgi:hypothetical protein
LPTFGRREESTLCNLISHFEDTAAGWNKDFAVEFMLMDSDRKVLTAARIAKDGSLSLTAYSYKPINKTKYSYSFLGLKDLMTTASSVIREVGFQDFHKWVEKQAEGFLVELTAWRSS